jgi:hypothetical protein
MMETNQLIGGFWNIRGLNKSDMMKCLADFINQNSLDFVGIQETKKASIEDSFLDSVNKYISRKYVLAKGLARGILVGFKNDLFDIISWQTFEFCVVAVVKIPWINGYAE